MLLFQFFPKVPYAFGYSPTFEQLHYNDFSVLSKIVKNSRHSAQVQNPSQTFQHFFLA